MQVAAVLTLHKRQLGLKTMSESLDNLRRAVKAEALTWLNTPYHPCSRLKGVGVDCVGLLAGIAEGSGVVEHVDVPAYSPQWHLHQNRQLLLDVLSDYCEPMRDAEAQTGDIFVFWFGKAYSHSALVLDYPLCIHANLSTRSVELVDVEVDGHILKCKRLLWRPFALREVSQ